MALTAREPEGSDLALIPPDTYQGICYAVVDFGTQHVEMFGNDIHKVLIGFELPEVRMQIVRDGVDLDLPRAISSQFTLSLHRKAKLRNTLESWRGKPFTKEESDGFDISKLLGVNAMIQVMHDISGRGVHYAKIANISKLYKGMEVLKAENEFQYFSFEEHKEIPGNIPEWMREKIMDSFEYQQLIDSDDRQPYHPDAGSSNDDDDIPF